MRADESGLRVEGGAQWHLSLEPLTGLGRGNAEYNELDELDEVDEKKGQNNVVFARALNLRER